ncbi:MAG: DNA polymerase/3'-5' exonuclease PolX [Planctomycetota bacterium]|nr:DNA polymerase/3'-5' exonuclease PolX [Planctomycetota bacterium]MDA1138642.1 DNA polymerase/3'-5' exonuclease PolX [Planctomycetota bacterium]
MENSQIAKTLSDLAYLLEIKGESAFRIRSYHSGVRAISDLTTSLELMVQRGEDLMAIKGIGKSIAGKIVEIIETKTCKTLEEVKKEVPETLLDMLDLEGMGPKKVKLIYEKLGIDSIEKLEVAAKAGKLRDLPGMGAKTEERLLASIEHFRSGVGRFRLDAGATIGEAIVEYMQRLEGIENLELAGSLRRRRETIGDLDLLVSCTDHQSVMDHFVAYPEVKQILAHGDTKSSVRLENGLQVDCRVVDAESFGAALHYFTGSMSHNVAMRQRGMERNVHINEYGVYERDSGNRIGGDNEEDVFKALGLEWVSPELRENRGEIEAAENGKLPELIKIGDIQGDLHMHTTATDGKHSILEMAEACKAKGYKYHAISDHSKAVAIANGLDEQRLAQHLREIEKANEQIEGIEILKSIEVDIMPDGTLDLEDAILSECDLVIASVHFQQKMPPDEMTDRILRAIDNPYVNVIAHPTGRLLLRREPFSFDAEKVFAAARDAGVCLEINAHPARLDLKDTHCILARELGVKIIINTDAHRVEELDLMRYGIWTARRGWLKKENVVNTNGLAAFKKAIARN